MPTATTKTATIWLSKLHPKKATHTNALRENAKVFITLHLDLLAMT